VRMAEEIKDQQDVPVETREEELFDFF